MELDKEQDMAVRATEAAISITAGPGSGKTRTIVERVAYLAQVRGVPPEKVLVVTFTNKAAREVRERFGERLSGSVPHVHTFHSFAHEIVRHHGNLIGLKEDISILTEKEQRVLVGTIVKDSGGSSLRQALRHIALAKANGAYGAFPRAAEDLLAAYSTALEKGNKMDFDDILIFAHRILSSAVAVRDEYADRFAYIIIDEFQDTNMLQMEIIRSIAGAAGNICAIGDPRQAIYGFRGGLAEAFDIFKAVRPETRDIVLTKNYRSSAPIRAVAATLFDEDRCPLPEDDGSPRVRMVSCSNPRGEAAYVAREIGKLSGGLDMNAAEAGDGYHLGEIAVIYRLNAVGRECEKELEKKNIPFYRFGATAFFDRPEIRKVLESLRMAPSGMPLKAAIAECIRVAHFENEEKEARAYELLSIAEPYSIKDPHEARRAFFAEIELSREEDDAPRGDVVTLLTAHAAKGLEFKAVFIIGCEEGLFPFLREGEDGGDIQEEKRLLYVALTRAKERLFITRSMSRTLFGRAEENALSKFLTNVPEKFIERETIRKKEKKKDLQTRLF